MYKQAIRGKEFGWTKCLCEIKLKPNTNWAN